MNADNRQSIAGHLKLLLIGSERGHPVIVDTFTAAANTIRLKSAPT